MIYESDFRQDKTKKLRKYHLRVMNLFAASSEGENRYIESMCQTMFSIDEILEVLCDSSIDHLSKTPYLKFGICVFLS